MFIKDHHGEMINIGDFSSINVAYRSYMGNAAHVIIGKYTFHAYLDHNFAKLR